MTDSTCETAIYDPAFQVTVPAVDARDEFKRLAEGPPSDENDLAAFASHKKARHATVPGSNGKRPTGAANDGRSRSIGFWYIEGQLEFANATASRHVIVFPDTVGGDFSSFLYLTSTNRSEKGTESHIAYVRQEPPQFFVYDWSLNKNERLARRVLISKMGKYVFPVSTQGFQRNGILVLNETRLLEGTIWANCVHLGVHADGKLHHFDTVYSNRYELDCNLEQQHRCNGYWGPEVEYFQDFTRPINAMGFTGCWLIQDGVAVTLNEANTTEHDDGHSLAVFYQTKWRDFLVQ
jgi:hypothetical protein